MVYVGIMGHGTVGSGVAEVLIKNVDSIAKRAGEEIQIKKILDLRDFPDLPYHDLFTKDVEEILADPQIRIVVEVMGGLQPAYTFTKKALLAGKHVVTSNKELVAQHGAELIRIGRENKVNYLFEASVGGGIPIIRPLKQCLAGNDITEISGILNGTTNYILSEMKQKGKRFDEALADAQVKGYAEKDPTADIEGFDAQRKIAILATIAFSQQILFSDIHTEGITRISRAHTLYADEMGYVIKLIASAMKTDEGIWARVCPIMLLSSNPLADVQDVFNAILVKGDAIGDVMFYGRGAGKMPTASAVVGDVIDAAKHLEGMKWETANDEAVTTLLDMGKIESAFFIRLKISSQEVLEEALKVQLPGSRLVLSENPLLTGEAAVVTLPLQEANLGDILKDLKNLSMVEGIIDTLRIENTPELEA